ncbi:MAG: hypothetical protein HY303_10310 [Candidatus Wallbacteria bacterium]|nr:hypothetical protein [Candidatus Wallbacteria bacterium]
MKLSSMISFAAVALAVALPSVATASTSNPPDLYLGRQGAVSCNLCHSHAGTGSGSVSIQGLPKMYEPGKSYPLTVKVVEPGAKKAGFRLAAQTSDGAQAGKIVNRDPSLDVHVATDNVTYLKQSYNGSDTNGSERSWTFLWKAPEGGSVKFSVDAVAGDGDGTVTGDHSYSFSASAQAGQSSRGQAD